MHEYSDNSRPSKPQSSRQNNNRSRTRSRTRVGAQKKVVNNLEDALPGLYAVGGIHTVRELLEQAPRRVHRVLFLKDSGKPALYELQKLCKKQGINTQQLPKDLLDSQFQPHQGVIALCHEIALADWTEMRNNLAADRSVPCLLVAVSGMEDPRNLGASIRSALALGAGAMLIPSKGCSGLSPTVLKAASGAAEHLPICRAKSLESDLDILREADFSVIGLSVQGTQNLPGYEFPNRCIIVVGGEKGDLPAFVTKRSDALLRIPMTEKAQSFNASVALSLTLYEAVRSSMI